MFLFLPIAFLIQCNEMKIICSMLKVMMLVSKERKSTRFFHSFFDLHSDITKQRRAWTEVETVIGKAESQPCRRYSQNQRKTQTESWDRPEEKRLTSPFPTEFIAVFLNDDIRLKRALSRLCTCASSDDSHCFIANRNKRNTPRSTFQI